LRTRVQATRTRIVASVPAITGDGVQTLTGPAGSVSFAANWSDAPRTVRFGDRNARVAAHSVAIRLTNVALAALGAAGDARRVSSDCDVDGSTLRSMTGCTVTVRDGAHVRALRLAANEGLTLPKLHHVILSLSKDDRKARSRLAITLPLSLSKGQGDTDSSREKVANADEAVVFDERGAAASPGSRSIVLANDRVRFAIDPDAGARAFSFRAYGTRVASEAFDATGALRDDVSDPLPPSPRDYIAKYTHAYPAGTFNRRYTVEILSSGTHARVRFTYAMPDANPTGLGFERVVSLEPHAARVVVDERLVLPPGSASNQRAVVRSSLPMLFATPLDPLSRASASALPAGSTALGGFRDGAAFVVAWGPGEVESGSWTPYRGTGTLALTLAPGWSRIVYAYAPVASLDAGRTMLEAEREWVAANPPDERP
jgi:hypothetical protein